MPYLCLDEIVGKEGNRKRAEWEPEANCLVGPADIHIYMSFGNNLARQNMFLLIL